MIPRTAIRMLAFCIIGVILGSIIPLSSNYEYFIENPQEIIKLIFVFDWKFIVLLLVICIFFSPAIHLIYWIRTQPQQRRITYVVDGNGIAISDAMGMSATIPWANVKRARRTDRLLLLHVSPGLHRYIPWRAFTPTDQNQLWSMVQTRIIAPKLAEVF